MARPVLYTEENKQAFLDAFCQHGRHNAAARAAGLSPSTVNGWLKSDEQFAEAYAEAQQDVLELLEEAAMARAVDGVEETRYGTEGQVLMHRRVYSDSLLITLLKANGPDKYKDRSASEITGAGGEPLAVASDLEAVGRIASLLRLAAERKALADAGEPTGLPPPGDVA